MNVPFLDLRAQYSSIKDEISSAIEEVFDSSAFAGGRFVEKFEKEWATYCGVQHAVGVGNGTDALWLAMLALGIGAGDEVITVPNSFIATMEAVTMTGAEPVLVDVDENCYTMNPELLESAITARTKAIIPVHLFGQTADMDPIMDIARRRGLYVIEDACQAHGAVYKGKKAGSMGDAGAFSFYPGKNLGAYGEAGAVVTNSSEVDEKIRMLRDHGQSRKYYHESTGWNARMDGIQGAVLQVKLRHLDSWNDARRNAARDYTRAFSGREWLTPPMEACYAKHVYHVYAIRVRGRDALMKAIGEQGVQCGIHYPVPIHLQNAYKGLGLFNGSFPVAEQCAKEFLSLPIFPEMKEQQIAHVTDSLGKALEKQQMGSTRLVG